MSGALVWVVWQNSLDGFVCILVLGKLFVLIGIDCEFPVASQHLIEENGGP